MKPLWYRSSETALTPLKWNLIETTQWNGYDTAMIPLSETSFKWSGSDTALSRINETAQMKPSGYQLETAQSRLWLLG